MTALLLWSWRLHLNRSLKILQSSTPHHEAICGWEKQATLIRKYRGCCSLRLCLKIEEKPKQPPILCTAEYPMMHYETNCDSHIILGGGCLWDLWEYQRKFRGCSVEPHEQSQSRAKAWANCSTVQSVVSVPVFRIRIRIGYGYNQVRGSGTRFGIRIRIRTQEGKNDPQKLEKVQNFHVFKCWMFWLVFKLVV